MTLPDNLGTFARPLGFALTVYVIYLGVMT
jgi:hypothetical protein